MAVAAEGTGACPTTFADDAATGGEDTSVTDMKARVQSKRSLGCRFQGQSVLVFQHNNLHWSGKWTGASLGCRCAGLGRSAIDTESVCQWTVHCVWQDTANAVREDDVEEKSATRLNLN